VVGVVAIFVALLIPWFMASPPSVVTSGHLLDTGGDQAMSPDGTHLAYDKADEKGVYHLYVASSDGSNPVCISCDVAPNRNVFSSVWTPDGKLLLVRREDDSSFFGWLGWNGQGWVSELEENGVWCDLYAVTPEGKTWTKLLGIDTTAPTDGLMQVHLSPDGTHVVWSKLTETAGTNNNPWGTYKIMEADFTQSPPSISNTRDITPKMPGHFFEAHGFSPDGSKLLFASDSGAAFQWNMNIFSLDLSSGVATKLTSGLGWYEHAYYTPSGNRITYMSSDGSYEMYETEVWSMNPDGSDKQQVTHFNTPGYAEYAQQVVMAGVPSFSADGTQMIVGLQLKASYPQRQMWLLQCNGKCIP